MRVQYVFSHCSIDNSNSKITNNVNNSSLNIMSLNPSTVNELKIHTTHISIYQYLSIYMHTYIHIFYIWISQVGTTNKTVWWVYTSNMKLQIERNTFTYLSFTIISFNEFSLCVEVTQTQWCLRTAYHLIHQYKTQSG